MSEDSWLKRLFSGEESLGEENEETRVDPALTGDTNEPLVIPTPEEIEKGNEEAMNELEDYEFDGRNPEIVSDEVEEDIRNLQAGKKI